MTTTLSTPVSHMGHAASPRGQWLQVVSHLDPRYGGLSAAVPALGRKLSEGVAIDTTVAAFCHSGEHYAPAGYDRQHLTYWPASRRAWLRNEPLRESLLTTMRRVDGVHIHGLWEASTAIAARMARTLGKPYLISAHGMLEPWALASKRLKKLVYTLLMERNNVARATALHALTQAEARQFVRFGARSPIAIIPNGVEIHAEADPELFLSEHPVLRGKRIFLFLARLHPKKGPDHLLEAWAALASSYPDAHLVLAGPDTEGTRATLEEFIARNGLERSVLLPGMLGEAMKWSALAAAECFLLPSHSEGLSVSVLEALGMGLPVIVTDACNMPEVLAADAGWQIPAQADGLTRALTATLAEALANPSLTNQEIGCRGADLITSRYTWASVAGQMATLYRWVQSGGPEPGNLTLVHP